MLYRTLSLLAIICLPVAALSDDQKSALPSYTPFYHPKLGQGVVIAPAVPGLSLDPSERAGNIDQAQALCELYAKPVVADLTARFPEFRTNYIRLMMKSEERDIDGKPGGPKGGTYFAMHFAWVNGRCGEPLDPR